MIDRSTPLAAVLTLSLLAGCGEAGDAIVDPVQPEVIDASKADGMSRDIVSTYVSETLRSTTLRNQLCDVIVGGEDIFDVFHQRDAFERDCADQHEFTVTLFHSSTDLQDPDGQAVLVAMDVLVDSVSPQGFAFATRLIRDRDDETLQVGWRPVLLDVLSRPADEPAPGVAHLWELIDEVNRRIGYPTQTDLAPFFEEVDENAEEPRRVLDDLADRVDAAESSDPGLDMAWGDWVRVVNSAGDHIGYMCPTTHFYPGEPYGDEVFTGTLYFYDVNEDFVDAVTWSY